MRRVPAIVAGLLAALLLATPALADTRSRDLRVATTTKIDTLNPMVGQLAAEYRVWALNYDLLIGFDPRTMEPDRQNSLAESWRVSRDRLKWTYRLKPGLHWSDGAPLTAHDVVWTMNFNKTVTGVAGVKEVKSWKAKDDRTVVATLSHPSVEMSSLWIYILPEHAWKAADTKSWEQFAPPLPLVGSGPYTVTRWDPNGTTVLVRNRFFRDREQNTGPQRVLMTYYGTGDGAVSDLEQNRLDVMPSDTLDVQNAQRLQRTSGVRVFQSPAMGLEYWVFNLAARVGPRVHKAVVQDRAVRTALAWAIDRSKLVQASLYGYGAPGNTQLSRGYGRFTLDLSNDPKLGYHYDPARARQILKRAGWVLGRDGVRRKHGARAEFELAYAGKASERRAVTLIRAWARDVGIRIDARVYDSDKLIDLELNKEGDELVPNFDTQLWSIDGDPTPEFLLSLFTRAQIGTWNDSGFTNSMYDQLYKQEVRAEDDAARLAAIRKLQRIATEQLPYIQLYEADQVSAVNTRTWKHWTTQPSPDGQPITSYGYSTIIALRPGRLATPSYAGVPWALAGIAGLVVLALGTILVARRREQREPIEISEAPA
jgi:peptide/nickel transport system substrate-binding protein